MTIEKAIEVLFLKGEGDFHGSALELHNALKLGIEALKREQTKRQTMSLNEGDILPGETKEN